MSEINVTQTIQELLGMMPITGEGVCSIYLFISAGAIESHYYFFITILLHQAHVKMTSVLVLFVIIRGLWFISI